MILTTFLMVASTVLRGWVLSLCWAWFMVPLGVTGIGIAQAIGLSAVVSCFTGPRYADAASAKADGTNTNVLLLTGMIFTLVYLAVGAIAHAFM